MALDKGTTGRKVSRKPKPRPVSPTTRQARRDLSIEKRQKREAEIIRLVDQSINGRVPSADIATALLGLGKFNKRETEIAKGRGVAAERERVQRLERLPGAFGFAELAKLAPGGTPREEFDPLYGGLEIAALFPFGRAGRGIKEGIETALEVAPGAKGVAQVDAKIARLTTKSETLARQAERLKVRREGPNPPTPQRARRLKEAEKRIAVRQQANQTALAGLRSLKESQGRPVGAERVVGSLGEARRLGREQEALRHVERGKRAGRAAGATERAGGGEAGFYAARGAIKGEMPRLPFPRLVKEFGEAGTEMRQAFQPQIDEMYDFITAHPSLRGRQFAIDNTKEALAKALKGELPTKSEIRLLENVFGDEAAKHLKWLRAHNKFLGIVNIPRTIQASYDLSFGGRQGLVVLARHPVLWGQSWKPALRAARTKEGYTAHAETIASHPNFETAKKAGVKFTNLGEDVRLREEPYMSNLAEQIPLVGIGVRISNRAYTAMANEQRLGFFNLLLDQAQSSTGGIFASIFRLSRPGLDELPAAKQEEVLRGIASLVNAGTGRGGMGTDALEKAAPLLSAFLFSPRLIASRLALLNPVYYAKLPPFARKEAARSMLQLVAAGTAVLYMAKQAGAEVVLDPRSADFGKIKLGNTRIDIWGGFQQYIVAGYRMAKGESVSSTTGQVKELEGGFGHKSRFDIGLDLLVGKSSPPAGYVAGLMGRPPGGGFGFDPAREAGSRLIPLGAQNAYEGFGESGLAGVGLHSPEFFGFGVQTYGVAGSSSKQGSKPGGGGRSRKPGAKPGGGGQSRKPGS